MLTDANRRRMYLTSRAASDAATISASADDKAMDRCRADVHITAAPCIMVTRPLVDWRVSTQPAQSESANVEMGWVASEL